MMYLVKMGLSFMGGIVLAILFFYLLATRAFGDELPTEVVIIEDRTYERNYEYREPQEVYTTTRHDDGLPIDRIVAQVMAETRCAQANREVDAHISWIHQYCDGDPALLRIFAGALKGLEESRCD